MTGSPGLPPLGAGDVVAGRYELVRPLGQGAMGAVFEARSTTTGRRVALKVIVEEFLRHAKARARFEVEARAAGAIDSEYVVQLLDAGIDEARATPFLAMELLAGRDLEAVLAEGPLAPDVVARLGIQACLGLEKAHAANVLHRDIKPANLFLAERDGGEIRVKLVDFGIAKILAPEEERMNAKGLTRTGQLLGSPLYMSPEQVFSGKGVDARTDVWSLGVVLYEALVGAAPLQHVESVPELLVSIGSLPAKPIRERAPWVPAGLAAAVERALVIDKGERHPSAAELRQALLPFAPSGWSLHARDLAARPAAPKADGALGAATTAMPSTEPRGHRLPVAAPPTAVQPARSTQVGVPSVAALGAPEPLPPTPVAPATQAPARRRGGALLGALVLGGAAAGAVVVRSLAPSSAREARANATVGSAPAPSASSRVVAATPHPSHAVTGAAPSAHPPPALPPSLALDPLVGRWRSVPKGNLFDAVRTAEGVEFRVVDAAQFAAQAYRAGERRFTLREVPGGLAVTDHLRPTAAPGAAYSDAGRAACLRAFDAPSNGAPLRARLDGAKLAVDLVVIVVPGEGYERRGAEIVACPGVDAAARSVVVSHLERVSSSAVLGTRGTRALENP